ncbi:hypothetical protein TNCV_372081 [Trichonephila clavipes]|nr:hypothetical protein TNCV_372081 [Trichonephila clavipes]
MEARRVKCRLRCHSRPLSMAQNYEIWTGGGRGCFPKDRFVALNTFRVSSIPLSILLIVLVLPITIRIYDLTVVLALNSCGRCSLVVMVMDSDWSVVSSSPSVTEDPPHGEDDEC